MSEESKAAWKANGASFTHPARDLSSITRMGYRMILNLGNSGYTYTCSTPMRVWNNAEDIAPLITQMYTRNLFDTYLPPIAAEDSLDFWIKGPGRGGRNKIRITGERRDLYQRAQWGYDVQEHIEGNEYRVVTVGNRVVQQHRRLGPNTDRSYVWLPADELPHRVRPTAKLAASRIPGANVIAWDFIVRTEDNEPFILEGNTSPGINENTAQRIIAEMNRQYEEANA